MSDYEYILSIYPTKSLDCTVIIAFRSNFGCSKGEGSSDSAETMIFFKVLFVYNHDIFNLNQEEKRLGNK